MCHRCVIFVSSFLFLLQLPGSFFRILKKVQTMQQPQHSGSVIIKDPKKNIQRPFAHKKNATFLKDKLQLLPLCSSTYLKQHCRALTRMLHIFAMLSPKNQCQRVAANTGIESQCNGPAVSHWIFLTLIRVASERCHVAGRSQQNCYSQDWIIFRTSSYCRISDIAIIAALPHPSSDRSCKPVLLAPASGRRRKDPTCNGRPS